MSVMSEYDLELQTISRIMEDQEPHDPVGQALRSAFEALDLLVVLANIESTKNEVRSERVMIGQILTRAQLLASFALMETPGKLKVIRNG